MKPLDIRTKFLVGIAIIALVIIAKKPVSLLFQTAIILSTVIFLKKITRFIHALKLAIPMVAFVFVISWLSMDFNTTLILCLRLFNLLISSFMVFQYISAEEIAGGLRKMKMPFAFVFMLTTAIRFVPLMQDKIRCIREAQMSRGIDLRLKLKNTKNFMALMGPLLVQAFILADELAVAMEVRGYGSKNRSFRKEYRFGFSDFIVMATTCVILTAFLLWEIL